jgi:hypothetical protein
MNPYYQPSGRTKIKVYYFNIDIMYVLKARLFILNKQLKQKFDDKIGRGYSYVCPDARQGKCTFKGEVDEITFESGRKTCIQCGVVLVHT